MKQIILTNEPKQKLNILFEDTEIIIVFRFNPTIQSWTMNITFRDSPILNGKKITIGLQMLKQLNKPFDIVAVENQNTGIDPFKQDDFEARVSLYLLERADVKTLRGYDVI